MSELTFRPIYVSMTAKDCETIYWLVQESGLEEPAKERLCRKLKGVYLSEKTEAFGLRMQEMNRKARAERRKQIKPKKGSPTPEHTDQS